MTLSLGQERRDPKEINVGADVFLVTFLANGELVLSVSEDRIQVWRVEDGKQMARMKIRRATDCCSLAVSKDSKWIAVGTHQGDVCMWSANTYKQVFVLEDYFVDILALDFSPDSTQLVSVSENFTVTVWDIATRKQVHALHHRESVRAAKYSPQGDRIAIATEDSIRVHDSNDGSSLVDIKVTVTLLNELLWSNNYLFVVSDSKIKQFEASTGSVISEWPLPDTASAQRIAIPKHGEFIAYSVGRTVTCWDTSTHAQLGLIQYSQDIFSIAVTPDDKFIAVCGKAGKFSFESLSPITVSNAYRWIRLSA